MNPVINSVWKSLQTYVLAYITVITHPDDTSTCLEGTAVFTCVLDIQNVSISTEDIGWWRKRIDQNNQNKSVPLVVNPFVTRYSVNNTLSGRRLTSVLTITKVTLSDMGPYYLGLDDAQELSNMAYLNIISNGMHVCMYAKDYTVFVN